MTILTFDSAIPFDSYSNGAGTLFYFGEYAEAGYALTGSRDDAIKTIGWDEGFAMAEGFHYDGPGVLATPAYESVTLVQTEGESFALRSIDLDTQWAVWKGVEVMFEGWTDSVVVVHTVVLDDVEGLQKIELPDSFANVTAVTWLGAGPSNIQFDNVEVALAENRPPVVTAAIPDQAVAANHDWRFAVSPTSFADVDGDALALSAALADGSALPKWLSFEDGVFSGTPPANARGILDVAVAATDSAGARAGQIFHLELLNPAGHANKHAAAAHDHDCAMAETQVGLLGLNAGPDAMFGS